jgi:hypothetical protein
MLVGLFRPLEEYVVGSSVLTVVNLCFVVIFGLAGLG